MGTTYSSYSKTGNLNRQSADNFLEALRDLGKGVVSEAKSQVRQVISRDIPEEFGLIASGTIQPNEAVSIHKQEPGSESDTYREAARLRHFEAFQQEQLARMGREESRAKEEIKVIRQEIQSIAKMAGDIAREFEIAAVQAPTNPGIYHKNFFVQLKSFLSAMRQRIQDSKEWLTTSNTRASKRSFYWSQVGKSGSKYMLSSERYMVTSTG